jgi:predicted TIM-barrel fold metal-dependent hydrolase
MTEMNVATLERGAGAASADHVVVVSADSHVGPRAKEDLRSYCPKEFLDDYDTWLEAWESRGRSEYDKRHDGNPDRVRRTAMNNVPGHYDMHEHLSDMNRDGVAADVIFHGSQNGEPQPFLDAVGTRFFRTGGGPEMEMARLDLQRVRVGLRMYNQWLADACSIEPERHVGLCHLPSWSLEDSVAEVRWAHAAGLRAVNFPAPRVGIRNFDDPEWEPFWNACEELGMTLSTHSGAGDPAQWEGPLNAVLPQLESSGYVITKGLHRLIFGGVFERHPRLKLVYTEASAQPSYWWNSTCAEFDAVWQKRKWQCGAMCPKPPSEYMREHVFLGASFLHREPLEPLRAIRGGYVNQVMWGSDYPHAEGTMLETGDGASTTRLSLSYIFAGTPEKQMRQMIGLNAAEVYGLDTAALAKVAARINAPTVDQIGLAPSPDAIPLYWTGED